MAEKNILNAKKRDISGKKVKQLRRAGQLVGSLSVPGSQSQNLEINQLEFVKLIDKTGESGLIYLSLDKKETPVVIDEIQYHPVSQEPIHVTLRKVSLTEKIEAEIEVELIGENKISGAVVVTVLDTIVIKALPTDIPEKFTVDISSLTEIGQTVNLTDLNFDKNKVELVLAEDQNPAETPVVILQEVKEEVVEEKPAEEVTEGEGKAEAQSTKDDGNKAEAESQKTE